MELEEFRQRPCGRALFRSEVRGVGATASVVRVSDSVAIGLWPVLESSPGA